MSSADKTIIAFDLYGTLLSTSSIAAELATHCGDSAAAAIATLWRRYQLEYTWRLNSMGIYKDFASVTRASLHHALAESGHSQSLSESDIDSLMSAYNRLESFPDVSSALETLKSSLRIHPYIFTNGSPSMVSASVHFSPSLSPWENTFRGIITVDAVQVYKPCPKAYHHLALSVGRTGTGRRDMEGIWLVSANPFDVVGARACGMEAVWVDREGRGWEDGLGMLVGAEEGGGGPTVVVRGVDEAVMEIRKRVEVR